MIIITFSYFFFFLIIFKIPVEGTKVTTDFISKWLMLLLKCPKWSKTIFRKKTFFGLEGKKNRSRPQKQKEGFRSGPYILVI